MRTPSADPPHKGGENLRGLTWIAIGVAIFNGLLLCLAASLLWSFRNLIVGEGSPQATARSLFALAIYGVTAINALAVLAFLIRRQRRAWRGLVVVEALDVLLSATLGVTVSATWWVITVLAAVALILLVGGLPGMGADDVRRW